MPVITISELKARFATKDKPTARDFEDMIDTLLEGDGASTPSGPAGGDLDGSYPDPVIGSNKTTFAKFQQISTNRLLGRSTAGTGNVEQLTIGTGLLLSGGELSAPPAGGEGEGFGTVAGAIGAYSSAAVDLPGSDGPVGTFQAPESFGTTLPQIIRVVAICKSAFAGYAVGEEVPIEHFVMKDNPQRPAFTVTNYLDGGTSQVTTQVKVEYGTAGAGTGIAVYARDLTTYAAPGADTSLTEFGSVAEIQSDFAIKVHMLRFEPGTGFGSVAMFEPADQVIPAAAGVATFTHNFGTWPLQSPMVSLVCVVADGTTGHSVNDFVPIESAFETGFANPAFGVTMTSDTILVRREATTIQIPHKTTGALTTLADEASWQIRVRAARGVNLPSIAFPALTLQISNPVSAFSYKNLMYVVHRDVGNGNTYLCRIDLTNNTVTPLHALSPARLHGNVAIFPMDWDGDPRDTAFICDTQGIHMFHLNGTDAENAPTTLVSGDYRAYKVLDIDEDSHHEHPNLLIVASYEGSSCRTNTQAVKKFTWGGASYTDAAQVGVDWATLSGIGGALYSQYQLLNQIAVPALLFSYNPIKRRIYMIHVGSGYLNIFKLDSGQTPLGWWDSDPDGTKVDFEKMLVVAGAGDTWTDTAVETYMIEYDTVTGAERAIVAVRRGHASLTGSVCRIPWSE